MRFVMIGAGFWARYQLSGWYEHPGVSCVGIHDRDRRRAERLAEEFGIPAVYDAPQAMLAEAGADFADVLTSPDTHRQFVEMCAAHRLPVVCQKPLAESLADAEAAVAACRAAGVPLLVNENWRWQVPIRAFGDLLRSSAIGTPFRGRLTFSCSFPVFENQPSLRETEQFILADIGSHVLDVARFYFGEASSLFATTKRVNPAIRGEDVATVVMVMGDARTTVTCEMSYASRTEHERFPQTYAFVEGDGGTLELGPDYRIRLTDRNRGSWDAPVTEIRRVPPPRYAWADPAYDLVHASIVACHGDLLRHLRGEGVSETNGDSNLETMRLVYHAYASAEIGTVVKL